MFVFPVSVLFNSTCFVKVDSEAIVVGTKLLITRKRWDNVHVLMEFGRIHDLQWTWL